MISITLLAIPIIRFQPAETVTVDAVNEKLVFAGKYGSRVITELTVSLKVRTARVT